MQVKVFKFDSNGKISFTQKELEKLLNEVYNGGYADGKRANNYWWWYPSNQYANISTLTTNGITLGQDSTSGNPNITWTTTTSTNNNETIATFKTDNCCEANNAIGD